MRRLAETPPDEQREEAIRKLAERVRSYNEIARRVGIPGLSGAEARDPPREPVPAPDQPRPAHRPKGSTAIDYRDMDGLIGLWDDHPGIFRQPSRSQADRAEAPEDLISAIAYFYKHRHGRDLARSTITGHIAKHRKEKHK
jgi:hypothetical protein